MPNMATAPIQGKIPLKSFLKNQNANGFATWYAALGMWALQNSHE